ncbi:MAG: hypothetical protein LBR22_08385 [Desulfovibrio sp.]|nr:hypothetical protein [Desulfovibrio sp.]
MSRDGVKDAPSPRIDEGAADAAQGTAGPEKSFRIALAAFSPGSGGSRADPRSV